MQGLNFIELIILIGFLSLSFAGFFLLVKRVFYKAKDSDNSILRLLIKLGVSFIIVGIFNFPVLTGIDLEYSQASISTNIKIIGFVGSAYIVAVMVIFSSLINIKETILSIIHYVKAIIFPVFLLLLSLGFGMLISSILFNSENSLIQWVFVFMPVLLMGWKINLVRKQITNWYTLWIVKYSKRPYTLVLRSFSDKTPLEAPGSLSINYSRVGLDISWVEGSSILTNLTTALKKFGPVVVLGEFTFSNKSDIATALQVTSNDDTWKCKIDKLAKGAGLIVIVPSSSKGVLWEINYLIEQNMLDKTLVFMPIPLINNFESNEMDLIDHWENLSTELKVNGINLPDYEGVGCIYSPKKDMSMKSMMYMDEVPYYETTTEIFQAIKKIVPPNYGTNNVRLKDAIETINDC